MNISMIFFAAVITTVTLYSLYLVSFKMGLTDLPSGRKFHKQEAALIGGISMFIGVSSSLYIYSTELENMSYFILTLFITTLIGMVDDMRAVSAVHRLLFQILIGLIVAFSGVTIDSMGYILGEAELLLQEWSVPITVIAVVGAINAVNFSDGIDGVAGALSMVTFSAIAFLVFKSGGVLDLPVSFIAALTPFLLANLGLILRKGKVFMGDAGSTMLGLGIVWLLIDFSQTDSKFFSPVTSLWIFAIPLIDIVSVILIRISHKCSPLEADNRHLHHVLRLVGYSDRAVLVIISGLAVFFAIIGICMELYLVPETASFLIFFTISLAYFALMRQFWRRQSI